MAMLGKFEGYTLREMKETDREQLKRWIDADRAHAGLLDPEFFMGEALDAHGELGPDQRVTVFALEDKHRVLMYIRLTRASRVHIQFPPTGETGSASRSPHVQRRQLSNALQKGMAFLEVLLERAGVMEWIFESEAPPLRFMAQRRLGFTPSRNEMVRLIPRLNEPAGEGKLLHMAPQEPDGEDGGKGAA